MSKTILVVDDSLSFRTLARMALEGAGYQVVEAENGEQALKLLDGPAFHCILSDLNMPRMDGLTFVAHVKAHPAQKFAPIMMLTTEGAKPVMLQGKAAGVRAWMVKPFPPSSLVEAVARLGALKS